MYAGSILTSSSVGTRCGDFLRRRNKNAATAATAMTPSATPTPMPALAPDESPLEVVGIGLGDDVDVGWGFVVVAPGAGDGEACEEVELLLVVADISLITLLSSESHLICMTSAKTVFSLRDALGRVVRCGLWGSAPLSNVDVENTFVRSELTILAQTFRRIPVAD